MVHVLAAALGLTAEELRGDGPVVVNAGDLRNLIQLALEDVAFDPHWYADTYPDIAEAWRDGRIKDLHEHFVQRGYFEGRGNAPNQVNEAWYRGQYPDIDEAVRFGGSKSAAEHYKLSGRFEWRSPSRSLDAEVSRWRKLFHKSTEPSGQ